ncbi:MAG: PilZ domain-containing protein [Aminobacteriaceae bacterium]
MLQRAGRNSIARAAASGSDKRRFARVPCALRVDFSLLGHDQWLPAEILDLSVAGMRIKFNPFRRGRTLRPELLERADGIFRFPTRGVFFQLDGRFLKVYHREPGLFTAGVEFVGASPEEQFKLVSIYADFRRGRVRRPPL